MRNLLIWPALVLVAAGCAPDTAAPARAAERFHAALSAHHEDAACAMLTASPTVGGRAGARPPYDREVEG
ncbi:hypothetical protein ABT120_09325 [Nonomuraea angiospora]|uniref:hypothetical protein n=1 Tax=Nonomuraea angiospora TaxID=46172 RepID=UPI00331D372D